MTGNLPLISIITPTFNRADEIEYLLDSINNQNLDHSLFEMIIADDGSTDSTRNIVLNWQNKVDFNLKYIVQHNKGPGAARNLGLKEAVGDLFVFIDSDCEAHNSWIKIIYKAYKNNEFDACGGPDRAKNDFTYIQKAIDFSMTSFLTTGGIRGHSENMIAKFYPRSHNMAMRRSVYENVGGFGSLRHGQDIELSHRIRKSGAEVKFLKNAIVYHRRRTSIIKFFRQVFNWGIARINLGKIDHGMLEPIHFIPSIASIIFFIITIGALINRDTFLPYLLIGFGLLMLACLIGGIKTRSILVMAILVAVIPLQVIGYGLGFLSAFISRYIFRSSELTGFTKNYYK